MLEHVGEVRSCRCHLYDQSRPFVQEVPGWDDEHERGGGCLLGEIGWRLLP